MVSPQNGGAGRSKSSEPVAVFNISGWEGFQNESFHTRKRVSRPTSARPAVSPLLLGDSTVLLQKPFSYAGANDASTDGCFATLTPDGSQARTRWETRTNGHKLLNNEGPANQLEGTYVAAVYNERAANSLFNSNIPIDRPAPTDRSTDSSHAVSSSRKILRDHLREMPSPGSSDSGPAVLRYCPSPESLPSLSSRQKSRRISDGLSSHFSESSTMPDGSPGNKSEPHSGTFINNLAAAPEEHKSAALHAGNPAVLDMAQVASSRHSRCASDSEAADVGIATHYGAASNEDHHHKQKPPITSNQNGSQTHQDWQRFRRESPNAQDSGDLFDDAGEDSEGFNASETTEASPSDGDLEQDPELNILDFHTYLPPVIDSLKVVKCETHPLHNIIAVYSNHVLVILEQAALRLLQTIFDPAARIVGVETTSVTLPIRLQDAPTAFEDIRKKVCKAAGGSVPVSPSRTGDDVNDRILSVAWHRESITLAVGTFRSLFIFKEHRDTQKARDSLHPFFLSCQFYIPLGWPCHNLFFINDGLLTKSTIYGIPNNDSVAINGLRKGPAASIKNKLDIISSQFFLWDCEFSRVIYSGDAPVRPAGPLAEVPSEENIRNSFPVIRESVIDAPLAEFVRCAPSPKSGFRAVAGGNRRPLGVTPSLVEESISFQGQNNDLNENFIIKIRLSALVPQPAGRFIAATYSVTVVSHADVGQRSSSMPMPSPVVRIWALRPRSVPTIEQNNVSRNRSTFPDEPGKARRRGFLKLNKKPSCGLSKKQTAEMVLPIPLEPVDLMDLQGLDWSSVRLRSSGEAFRPIARAGSTPHEISSLAEQKANFMALLVNKGMIGEEDLAGYLRVTSAGSLHTTKGDLTTPSTVRAQSGGMAANVGGQNDETEATRSGSTRLNDSRATPYAVDGSVTDVAPLVTDGPYLTTALNHRAPILNAQWLDEGVILDGLFSPGVISCIGVDNSVAIWRETSPRMTLRFECVITIKLDISPLKNFFHPLDLLPGQAHERVRTRSKTQPARLATFASANHRPHSSHVSFSGMTDLIRSGLCSKPFGEGSISICWLAYSRSDSHKERHGASFLRLAKFEARSKLIDLDLLEAAPDAAVHAATAAGTKSGYNFVRTSSKGNGPPNQTPLPLRSCGHPGNVVVIPPELPFPRPRIDAALEGLETTRDPNFEPPSLSFDYKLGAVDFLLMCEVSRGADGPVSLAWNAQSRIHGFWVYAFRDLTTQPYGTPAVKRILAPRNLPIPCKIKQIISADVLPSLGLSDAYWGDGSPLVRGEPVSVEDGVILPPMQLVVLSIACEIWKFIVQPTVTESPQGGAVDVTYEIRLRSVFNKWRPPCHVVNEPHPACSQSAEILRYGKSLKETRRQTSELCHGMPLVSPAGTRMVTMLETPLANLVHSVAARSFPGRPLARLRLSHWRSLEEHPYVPAWLLAVDSRGWASVGVMRFMIGDGVLNDGLYSENAEKSQYGSETFSKKLDLNAKHLPPHNELFNPIEHGEHQTTETLQQNFNVPHVMGTSVMVCLNSIGTAWASGAVAHLEPEETRLIGTSLPSFSHACWLPIAAQPPIIIATAAPQRRLLALEVAAVPGQCPRVTAVPFFGTFCGSLASIMFFGNGSGVEEGEGTETYVGSFHPVPHSETHCFLVVRVTVRDIGGQDHGPAAREDHVLILRCDVAHSVPDPRRCIRLTLIADAFLDYSLSNIGVTMHHMHPDDGTSIAELHPSSTIGHLSEKPERKFWQDGLDKPSPPHGSGDSDIEDERNVYPILAVAEAPTAGCVLAMLASFPPLDFDTELTGRVRLDPWKMHDGLTEGVSYVGIYDVLECGATRLVAWAAVPVKHRLLENESFQDTSENLLSDTHKKDAEGVKQQAGHDVITGISLCTEWVAVITSHALLYFYALLDAPVIPELASLSRGLLAAGAGVGFAVENLPPLAVPVLIPTQSFDLSAHVSRLQGELNSASISLEKYARRAVDESSTHDIIVDDNDSGEDSEEDSDARYFNAKPALINDDLQIAPSKFDSTRTRVHFEDKGSKRNAIDNSTVRLLPSEDCPLLTFKRSKGDSLYLLVSLRLGGRITSFTAAGGVVLEAPPVAMPLIFYRSRVEGREIWLRSTNTLLPAKGAPLLPHATFFANSADVLMFSASLIPSALHDGCQPPLTAPLPHRLRENAQTAAHARPLYHPTALIASLKVPGVAFPETFVLRVLHRLLDSLIAWRHCHRPIPPNVGFSASYLAKMRDTAPSSGDNDKAYSNIPSLSGVLDCQDQEEPMELRVLRDTVARLLTQALRLKQRPTYESEASNSSNASHSSDTRTGLDVQPRENVMSAPQVRFDISAKPRDEAKETSVITEAGKDKNIRAETAAALIDEMGNDAFDDFDDLLNSVDSSDLSAAENAVLSPYGENPRTTSNVANHGMALDTPSSPSIGSNESFDIALFNGAASRSDDDSDRGIIRKRKSSVTNSPLTEASQDDLLLLIKYLDVTLPHNAAWLEYHESLVPGLTLAETAHLLGLVRLLYDLIKNSSAANEGKNGCATAPSNVASLFEIAGAGHGMAAGRYLFGLLLILNINKALLDLVTTIHNKSEGRSLKSAEVLIAQINADNLTQSALHYPASWVVSNSAIFNPLELNLWSLRTSDIAWAVTSNVDEVALLNRVIEMCRDIKGTSEEAGKTRLSWPSLRAAGVGFWLRHPGAAEKLVSEDLPRDIYLQAQRNLQTKSANVTFAEGGAASADPSSSLPDCVALWYVVSGRLPVLRALYKAVKNMKTLEFLSHDFTDRRWASAATRNAYILVRKRRFELAVAFFILGGSYTEAMDVCCGRMDDPQLALLLALILEIREERATGVNSVSEAFNPAGEPGSKGLVGESAKGLRERIISERLLPFAVHARDSWLQSICLWSLKRHAEAVAVTLPPDLRPTLYEEKNETDQPVQAMTKRGLTAASLHLSASGSPVDSSSSPFSSEGESHINDVPKQLDSAFLPPETPSRWAPAIRPNMGVPLVPNPHHRRHSRWTGFNEETAQLPVVASLNVKLPAPSIPLGLTEPQDQLGHNQTGLSDDGLHETAATSYFCHKSILLSPHTPSIRAYRQHLLVTPPLRRLLQSHHTASALALSITRIHSIAKCMRGEIADVRVRLSRRAARRMASLKPEVIAAFALLCDGAIVSVVDHAESILYALTHRLPFNGLFQMACLARDVMVPRDELGKLLARRAPAARRLRWPLAASLCRNICAALPDSAAAADALDDVVFLDEFLQLIVADALPVGDARLDLNVTKSALFEKSVRRVHRSIFEAAVVVPGAAEVRSPIERASSNFPEAYLGSAHSRAKGPQMSFESGSKVWASGALGLDSSAWVGPQALKLASIAWKQVVTTYVSGWDFDFEYHGNSLYKSSDFRWGFDEWLQRQTCGAPEIELHGMAAAELPKAPPEPQAPKLTAISDLSQENVGAAERKLKRYENDEKNVDRFRSVVAVFADAFRGLPAWSLLSPRLHWTEVVLFRGLSSCSFALARLIGRVTAITDLATVSSAERVAAKSLSLAAAVKTAIAWTEYSRQNMSVDPATKLEESGLVKANDGPAHRIQTDLLQQFGTSVSLTALKNITGVGELLVAQAVISTGLLCAAGILLLGSFLSREESHCRSSPSSHTPSGTNDDFGHGTWPFGATDAQAWHALSLLLLNAQRLELCFHEIIGVNPDAIDAAILSDLDRPASISSHLRTELLRVVSFLGDAVFLPKPEAANRTDTNSSRKKAPGKKSENSGKLSTVNAAHGDLDESMEAFIAHALPHAEQVYHVKDSVLAGRSSLEDIFGITLSTIGASSAKVLATGGPALLGKKSSLAFAATVAAARTNLDKARLLHWILVRTVLYSAVDRLLGCLSAAALAAEGLLRRSMMRHGNFSVASSYGNGTCMMQHLRAVERFSPGIDYGKKPTVINNGNHLDRGGGSSDAHSKDEVHSNTAGFDGPFADLDFDDSAAESSFDRWIFTLAQGLMTLQSTTAAIRDAASGEASQRFHREVLATVALDFPLLPMAVSPPPRAIYEPEEVRKSGSPDTASSPAQSNTLPGDMAASSDKNGMSSPRSLASFSTVDVALVDCRIRCLGSHIGLNDGFAELWVATSCSKRLQYLLSRGAMGLPAALGLGVLSPFQLPSYSRVVALIKEAPLSITVDRAAGLSRTYSFPTVTPYLSSDHRYGLNAPRQASVGVLVISTSRGLRECNVAHSLLFHRSLLSPAALALQTDKKSIRESANKPILALQPHFSTSAILKVAMAGSTATSSNPMNLSGVGLNSVGPSAGAYNSKTLTEGSASVGPLLNMTNQNVQTLVHDDDYTGPLINGSLQLRPYAAAADMYERHISEDIGLLYSTNPFLWHSETLLHQSEAKEHESKNSRAEGPAFTPGRLLRKHGLLRGREDRMILLLSRQRRRLPNAMYTHGLTPKHLLQELHLDHINMPFELLLRGLLTSTADLPLPPLSAFPSACQRFSDGQNKSLIESIPLLCKGFVLLSRYGLSAQTNETLTSIPHKDISSSLERHSAVGNVKGRLLEKNSNEQNMLPDTTLTGLTRHKSTYAWLHQLFALQRKLARNNVAEVQMSCRIPVEKPKISTSATVQPVGPGTAIAHHSSGAISAAEVIPNSSLSLLRAHPNLPVCAGVIADGQVITTRPRASVIKLWRFSDDTSVGPQQQHLVTSLGYLTLAGTMSKENRESDAAGSRDATGASGRNSLTTGLLMSSGVSLSKRSVVKPRTPFLAANLTYTEAGPIKNLEWSPRGDRLVAAHNNGWVTIWTIRNDLFLGVPEANEGTDHLGDNAAPQSMHAPSATGPTSSSTNTKKQNTASDMKESKKVVNTGGTPTSPVSTGNLTNDNRSGKIGGTSAAQSDASRRVSFLQNTSGGAGAPTLVFKPHSHFCRFASAIATFGRDLVVTSGRGLLPTQVQLPPRNCTKRVITNSTISAAADEGVVCVWDLSSSAITGHPVLLTVDLDFEKNSYATSLVLWPARQTIIYSGKRGEVRFITLSDISIMRYPRYLIHPVGARLQQKQRELLLLPRDQQQQQLHSNHLDSVDGPPTPGPFGIEIVKAFVLPETSRLVTCYDDAMVRVWDLSMLCTQSKSLLSPAEPVPFFSEGRGRFSYPCAPLLWESPYPLHASDSSRLSLVANILGSVFNIAPGGSPRILLDAILIPPAHLFTVGVDGAVVLTRL